jgi:protein translocase SecG subunit
MPKEIIAVFQILTALILTFFILIQVKGTGFGRVWGATSASFTRRGLEKIVFRLTFVLSFLFIILSIVQLLA